MPKPTFGVTQLVSAIMDHDIDRVGLIMRNPANRRLILSPTGNSYPFPQTPLEVARRMGNDDITKLLNNLAPKPYQSPKKKLSFEEAVVSQNIPLVRNFLRHDKSRDAILQNYESGLSIYHKALKTGNKQLISLIESATPSSFRLEKSIERNDLQAVRKILHFNPYLVRDRSICDSNGRLFLVNAVDHGNRQIVEALLKAGADLEAAGPMTPLAKAVQNNDMKMVNFLLDKGAKIENNASTGYITPLALAVVNENIPMADLLLARGASVRSRGLIDPNDKNPTPTTSRVANGFTYAVLAEDKNTADAFFALFNYHGVDISAGEKADEAKRMMPNWVERSGNRRPAAVVQQPKKEEVIPVAMDPRRVGKYMNRVLQNEVYRFDQRGLGR